MHVIGMSRDLLCHKFLICGYRNWIMATRSVLKETVALKSSDIVSRLSGCTAKAYA